MFVQCNVYVHWMCFIYLWRCDNLRIRHLLIIYFGIYLLGNEPDTPADWDSDIRPALHCQSQQKLALMWDAGLSRPCGSYMDAGLCCCWGRGVRVTQNRSFRTLSLSYLTCDATQGRTGTLKGRCLWLLGVRIGGSVRGLGIPPATETF